MLSYSYRGEELTMDLHSDWDETKQAVVRQPSVLSVMLLKDLGSLRKVSMYVMLPNSNIIM